ncbi:MAG: hypothetical protein MUE69_05930 [Myxococcota bacterium]|nr:hypothetical protein [Myxococcota bacterium]
MKGIIQVALYGAALTATSLLHGCVTEVSKLGASCERNTQCDAPLVCRLARCRQECASARDCPIGSVCVTDTLGVGACRLPDEASCVRPSDCPTPLVCLAGACTNECASDRDCAPGGLCDPEAGCVDLAERACVLDSECAPLTCARDGRCREECANDRDCRVGSACVQGACDRLLFDGGTPEDAGTDASLPDAGFDASEPDTDAGVDASMAIDGGVDGGIDAGPPGPACPGGISECGSVPNASLACTAGFCEIASCRAGYLDCDGVFENGCEVMPQTDVSSCGACGVTCEAGEVCVGRCEAGRIEDVVVGHAVSCVLFSTGHVACWGANTRGQTGDGSAPFTNTVRADPVLVVGLTDAVEIVIGASRSGGTDESHACARRVGGSVVCWGSNRFAQTGMSATTTGRSTPNTVPGLIDALELAAGDSFTCARRVGGTVACWGSQADGRLGNEMVAPAAVATPVTLTGIGDATSLVGSADAFACVEVGALEPRCWGTGGFENTALGAGRRGVAAAPVAATRLTGIDLTSLVGGVGVSYGVDEDGRVRCWGSSFDAKCGPSGTTSELPLTYEMPLDVVEVAGGNGAVWARTASGSLFCWGRNSSGQCALGTLDTPIETPTLLTDFADTTSVAAGSEHSCVLRRDGSVWCAGANAQGQLGNGSTGPSQTSFVPTLRVP